MGWPQIVWIVLAAMSLGANLVMHGKPKKGSYNFFVTLVSTLISYGILSAGGFFP